MAIYIILALLVSFSFFIKRKKEWNAFILICLSIIAIIRGKSVGLDVEKYYNRILTITFDTSNWHGSIPDFEDGYNYLIAIFNSVLNAPMVFIGLCTVFYILSFNRYIRKYETSGCVGLFLMYMLGYYIQSFNIIRQYFALGLVLLFLSYVDIENNTNKQKLLFAGIIFFVGTFFHNTAYMFLSAFIYYYINKKKYFTKKYMVILLVITCVLYQFGIVKGILQNLGIGFLLNEKTNMYYQSSIDTQREIIYSFYRLLLDNIFLIYLIIKSKKIDIFGFFYIFGQLCINLFASLNPLFARISIVLFVAAIPFTARIWIEDKSTRKFILIYVTLIFINLLSKNYGEFLPYVVNPHLL